MEWRAAKSADRTAATFETWLGERVTQVAVAWVLATVFVRFCEDNGLIEYPFIAGPGDPRRQPRRRELQQEFYEDHRASDDRDWLEAAFDAMSVSPVAAGLFDRSHNPMWTIQPTPHAIKALLEFWRQTGEDGKIRLRFRRSGVEHPLPRRPLPGPVRGGAQDVCPPADPGVRRGVHPQVHARPRDRGVRPGTRPPARPRGPAPPACASSTRPAAAATSCWARSAACCRRGRRSHPTTDQYELIAKALSSVHGVDKNPFAAAIARFRLMLAAMRAAGVDRLTEQRRLPDQHRRRRLTASR